ncbi:MAG TPA: restriction endonuclease [Verrucomicrobiae bacterium]|nr:restriction endonuclease [Verrucomicrobiae bacterium]
MGRSKNIGFFEMLMERLEAFLQAVPSWAPVPVAMAVFFAVLAFWDAHVNDPILRLCGYAVGGLFAFICLLIGLVAIKFQRRQDEFLHEGIDLAALRKLGRRQFKHQMAQVYRQQGYVVEEVSGRGAEVDLKLFEYRKTIAVQFRHWNTWRVNVQPVRKLFNAMTEEKAQAAVFITSGDYTPEARRFAAGKPIELIGHDEFIKLVRKFQKDVRAQDRPGSAEKSLPEASPRPVQ